MTLAFKAMPAPDWAEATTITIPSVPTHTSEEWAQAVFDVRNVPAPVLAMFWLRERIVGLLGIAKGRPDTFAVDKIADGEALIEADEKHLRFVRLGSGRQRRRPPARGHRRGAEEPRGPNLLRTRSGTARRDHAGNDDVRSKETVHVINRPDRP